MHTPVRWKAILVPHDFSASANHAAAIARDQAKLHGGTVVLLHVVELPPHFGPDTTLVLPEGHQTPIGIRHYAEVVAAEHLADLATRLGKDGVEVARVVRVGNAVDEINRVASEPRDGAPIDVIVMGTHGRTGIRHLVTGSVTERVVRTSSIPVMTVRHPG